MTIAMRFRGLEVSRYAVGSHSNGSHLGALKSRSSPESDFKTSGLYARCCSAERRGALALDLVRPSALAVSAMSA